jgi:hypothetical protein
MKSIIRILLIVLVIVVAVILRNEMKQEVAPPEVIVDEPQDASTTYTSLKGVEIIVNSPMSNETIVSPLTISGQAPGYWFFEASFPFMLINWDGLMVAQGYAMTADDWMTKDLVSFEGVLEFEVPEYSETGTLFIQRDNPSDLAENDDSFEIPVRFR